VKEQVGDRHGEAEHVVLFPYIAHCILSDPFPKGNIGILQLRTNRTGRTATLALTNYLYQ